jgi:2-oxo-4-hydroxy-4-carboxy-5-ureidoimidazoline decarboxylase
MKPMVYSADLLSHLPREDFVAALGGVFEHSPWVAEAAWAQRPFASIEALHGVMCAVVDAAGSARQLALVKAHPELAGKAAVRGELTPESSREQSGAGLDLCSPQEFEKLQALNHAYREKFGFPFILAVRGYDRAGVLANFEARVQHAAADELRESLRQIYRIARFRLDDLSAHATGRPSPS